MTATGEIHNKPPHIWSTVPSSNGINRSLNIHPATQNEVKIANLHNIQKLVKHATRHIPGSKRVIDQHFSDKSYSSFKHVSLNRPVFDHVYANPF